MQTIVSILYCTFRWRCTICTYKPKPLKTWRVVHMSLHFIVFAVIFVSTFLEKYWSVDTHMQKKTVAGDCNVHSVERIQFHFVSHYKCELNLIPRRIQFYSKQMLHDSVDWELSSWNPTPSTRSIKEQNMITELFTFMLCSILLALDTIVHPFCQCYLCLPSGGMQNTYSRSPLNILKRKPYLSTRAILFFLSPVRDGGAEIWEQFFLLFHLSPSCI